MFTKGSTHYENSFSGVPSTNKGMLMFAILVNAVTLQLFGSYIFGPSFSACLLPLTSSNNIKGI